AADRRKLLLQLRVVVTQALDDAAELMVMEAAQRCFDHRVVALGHAGYPGFGFGQGNRMQMPGDDRSDAFRCRCPIAVACDVGEFSFDTLPFGKTSRRAHGANSTSP